MTLAIITLATIFFALVGLKLEKPGRIVAAVYFSFWAVIYGGLLVHQIIVNTSVVLTFIYFTMFWLSAVLGWLFMMNKLKGKSSVQAIS